MAAHRRLSSTYSSPAKGNGRYNNSFKDFNGGADMSADTLPPSVKGFFRRTRRTLRSRLWFLLTAVSVISVTLYILRHPITVGSIGSPKSFAPKSPDQPKTPIEDEPIKNVPPPVNAAIHPMKSLIKNAQQNFDQVKARQSKTLSEAVAEYRRRYRIAPPPKFDKWYEFATSKGVQLIDEYDTIHESLTPFWGMKPSTIRARARETMGFDNVMISLVIRHGNVTKIDGGRDWMQEAILGMTKDFIQYLPDVDLCFNAHDEPRVILPHDDLVRLVEQATNYALPGAALTANPRNEWSGRPSDMNDGSRIEEIFRTRFNHMEKQETWTHSRMSCSPNSPSRSIWEGELDDISSYAVEPLGLIYNTTAFSDICHSPSFADTYGFFAGANVFNIVHDLFPIFSQSKISSYQDIVYPSPWYWYNKVVYDEKDDMEWREKEDKLYWRGSTTGGYSRAGSWRRQHRQHFVQKINAADNTNILQKHDTTDLEGVTTTAWKTRSVFRPEYEAIIDVAFSHIGQCDPGDCTAQKEFFSLATKAPQSKAWKSKFLLDIDGNAFSGRFYAFLKSKSLVFKLALSREWHHEFVKPWIHFVPFSLRGDEWLEGVRWFLGEEDGKVEGERMAKEGTDWSKKVLRNEDMEVWMFRLLLEYGRVVDDNRETIGFSIPETNAVKSAT